MAKVFMDRRDIAKRIMDSELALKQALVKEAEDREAVAEYVKKIKLLKSDGLVYMTSYRIINNSLIDKKAVLGVSKVAVLLEKQKLDQLKKLAEQLEVQYRSLETLATKAMNNIAIITECRC
jgi:hypothetical protein